MLAESFVFLPGIGLKTEARLWRRGIRDWTTYLEHPRKPDHPGLLARAGAALAARDGAFFAYHLPRTEHWRTWRDFGDGAIAVDIETDDRGITVVGVHGPRPLVEPVGPHDRDFGARATRFLVRGEDLTPQAVSQLLAPARMLLSFNGASFDLPALAAYGARIPHVPHADLVAPLRRAGFRGGLKKVEVAAGLSRHASVAGLSGFDAILLWRQHELGDPEALGRLLLYNAYDVENLFPLADLAYDRLRAAMMSPPTERALTAFA